MVLNAFFESHSHLLCIRLVVCEYLLSQELLVLELEGVLIVILIGGQVYDTGGDEVGSDLHHTSSVDTPYYAD